MTAPDIQQEIERTREHLAETVEELAAKADVKARARVRAAEAKARAQDRAAQVSGLVRDKTAGLSGRVRRSQMTQRRWPLAVAAGLVVAGAAVIRRRRKA